MTSDWPIKKLRGIADIRVSSVDKKTRVSEKPVKLCNYMDVYSNTYISNRLNFMEASASAAEIERFALNCGDVLITKDSETPDDIGIPAVITETVKDLICGYHLALIRPDADKVDSLYLTKQLSSSRVARYFALHASGSTRYGLPIAAIEAVTIPTPPIQEQRKIAEILSTLDRAIEQTEVMVAKQQRLKSGLMRDLFRFGIDDRGRLRSTETDVFQDSPLGKIPVGWRVARLESVGTWASGGTPSKGNPIYWGDEIPWMCPRDMKTFDLGATLDGLTRAGVRCGSKEMPINTVFIVVRGMILAHTFPVCIASVPMAFNQDVKAIVANPDIEPRFLAYWLVSHANDLLKITTTATHGTKRFDMKELFDVLVAIPERSEQERIVNRLNTVEAQIGANREKGAKFRYLRTALMQELLAGEKRVTALLDPATHLLEEAV
jgi:type I restriction enzyme S subunit